MASLLRLVAVAISALVVLGFAAFAWEELERGSRAQQEKLASGASEPAPAARGERQRERAHGPVREAIDDANDVLLDPFAGIVDSNSPWVTRGVPSLLALAVFGFGLGMLANFRPKRSSGGDWRDSDSTHAGIFR
jgi:hypothetical protein